MARDVTASPASARLRADGREQAVASKSVHGDRFAGVITIPSLHLAWIVPLVRKGQRQTA